MNCEREIADYRSLATRQKEQERKVKILETRLRDELRKERDKMNYLQNTKNALYGQICRKLIENPQELQKSILELKAIDAPEAETTQETQAETPPQAQTTNKTADERNIEEIKNIMEDEVDE